MIDRCSSCVCSMGWKFSIYGEQYYQFRMSRIGWERAKSIK